MTRISSIQLPRCLAVMILLSVCSTAANATSTLNADLARVAEKIKPILDRHGGSLTIGQFTGPAQHLTNFGPGIMDVLTQELTRLKVGVAMQAPVSLQGEIVKGLVKDPSLPSDLLVLKLLFRLYDRTGEPITELPLRVELKENDDLARVLGATGSLSPKGDKMQRNQDLQDILSGDKGPRLDGTRILASDKSPFAVELVVKGAPRQPRLEKNNVFVDIERDEIYEVRLHNNFHLDAAITLHIDGLDVFTFSDVRDAKGKPRYSHFILPPNSVTAIQGWHKRNDPPDNFLSFLVTEYGKGASRQATQPAGKLGIITVTFAYAWTGDMPAEERGARDSGNETGFGPPVSQRVQEVQRHIGVVRDVVSIRYTR